MRYLNIETISFTTKNGKTVPVKAKRPITPEDVAFEVDIREDAELDEIASRREVYGSGAEDQAYRIFDANVVKIVERGYDLSKIRKLGIPE